MNPKMGRALYRYGFLVIDVGGLAGVLVALRAGASFQRWWPVVAFLAVAVSMEIYVRVVGLLRRRRSRIQRGGTVPMGIRLRPPLWMQLSDAANLARMGGPLGGAMAAAGLAGVAVGILLTVFALLIVGHFFGFLYDSLTFEAEGLRVHLQGASFLVRWDAVSRIDRVGSEERYRTEVAIDDIRPVMRSLSPDTEGTRMLARIALGTDKGPSGKLTLEPWVGGWDDAVLASALNAAVKRQIPRAN